jgi:hypothetical protein
MTDVQRLQCVTTELRVIAQDEFGEHEPAVREVCAEAAAQILYYRQLVARISHHEKELRDELDALRGIIR